MTNQIKRLQVGDWVRFYRGGALVIGIVNYIHKDILGKTVLQTDVGAVDSEYVLEHRRHHAAEGGLK